MEGLKIVEILHLCAVSHQDMGNHGTPQLSILCISKQCFFSYYPSQPLFCHPFTLLILSTFLFPFSLKLPHCLHALFTKYPSLKPHLCCLKSLHLWWNCSAFTAIQKDWYYLTTEYYFFLFLLKFSWFLILCLALGRHLSLFQCTFGF